MSGHYDYELQRREEERKRYLKERNLLSKTTSNLSSFLREMVALDAQKTEKVINDLSGITKKSETLIKDLKEMDKKSLEEFRNKRVVIVKKIEEEIKRNSDIATDFDFAAIYDTIQNSSDKYEIMKKVGRLKAEVEFKIEEIKEQNKKRRWLYELFGLNSEKDFENEEKVAMFELYEQLTESGYNPIYDPTDNKIIVEKDNGNQIVAGKNKDTGKMRLDFLSFEGKSCSKDMLKIEKKLRKNGIIEIDQRIYTHWYNKDEQKQYESSEIKLKNKNIYTQLTQKQGSLYGGR